MIVREAYRDRCHAVCRRHYNGELAPPADAPPLGQVQDARERGCEWCDEARAIVLRASDRRAVAILDVLIRGDKPGFSSQVGKPPTR